jgi:transposase
MTRHKRCRWSTRFRRSKAREGDHGAVRTASSVIVRMTRSSSVTVCASDPLLAVRRTRHGSGLGRWRWVVGRTFAWLNQFRRLRVRYDKGTDIHEAFLSLGCALIRWQSLRKTWATD